MTMTRARFLAGLAASAAAATLPRHAGAQSPVPQPEVTPMLTRAIPSSGEAMPVIGLGTYQVFDVGRNAAMTPQLAEVLRVFLAGGGKMIDSSPMYGSAEAVTGELVTELKVRSQLFLATKVWTSGRDKGIA